MKKLILLLLWPLVAQAQVSTYSLSWDSVPVSPATSVIGYCSINDGTYFQAITVQTIQNTVGVAVDLKPGDKISCYAKTTDGTNYSPNSNISTAYEPIQVSTQLCVAGRMGVWKAIGTLIFAKNLPQIYGSWFDLKPQGPYQVTGSSLPGQVCGNEIIMQIGAMSFHSVPYGMTICTLQ